jgi:hypothetical protein
LEYWLDVSLFSQWKRPAVKLPFHPQVFQSDVQTYGKLGVRHITTFAVFIDTEYVKKFGVPPLDEYGKNLFLWQP